VIGGLEKYPREPRPLCQPSLEFREEAVAIPLSTPGLALAGAPGSR
jgi:hypothetical protein